MEHKEKQEIKWADVAHYYSQSSIKGFLNWGPNANKKIGKPFTCTLVLQIVDGMATGRLVFTPLLRALEDMTEEEARELFALVGQPIHNARLDEIVADYGIRKRTIPEYVVEYVVECSFKLSISTVIQHWLIQRGFDVFGLITSGQAIRKDVKP